MCGVWGTVALTVFIIIAVVFLFKIYLRLSTGWNRSPRCLIGKTAIVTGANTGIGYYTALDFAKRGARVILACRNPARAEEARSRIMSETDNANVHIKILDLGSLASVREFAKDVNATEQRLDILVNNAGAAGFDQATTADGLSASMQVNYFGPFLLTNLLLDILKRSTPSRIVVVSSDLAHLGSPNVEDLNAYPTIKIFGSIFDYANNKLCGILFANELARKLQNTGVTANSVHPGAVQSDFLRNLSTVKDKLMKSLMYCLYKTTEEGCQTSTYVAISKDIEGVTGEYFADCKKSWMPRRAKNEELAKKLWERSEQFVKLTPEEKAIVW